MEFIRALMISFVLLCFPTNSAELLLHFEIEKGRLLVMVVNESDESFLIDQDSFRISSLGKLYFEFKGSKGRAYELAALINDRSPHFENNIQFGSVVGQVFYLDHLLSDYDVIDKGQYTVTAYLCDKWNSSYDDKSLKREETNCLISNQIEFEK